ncbi:DUF2726 domain-containing protein [Paragemmobacter ruber]|uniref:DUF2726 domain-containing protein n=1 Tax=Paragemmobacter ruber TaxID=1985673 RepID=A0ABW9Y7Y9_9RHOB|nr:DUF2726 domain-containing protein [Rhodobacter ruber]NBE08698.1 DUF2726 domain-containing protein [Rhodobacter ruber]
MMNDISFSDALALLAITAVIAHALYLHLRPRRRRRRSHQGREQFSHWEGKATPRLRAVPDSAPLPPPPAPDLRDPAQQLHAIARVTFEPTPLLNRQEARLLPLLESITRDLRTGHRVMAQTSLGELIRPKPDSATEADRSAAFASINAKRLDFAIIDRGGRLAVAVEYQGEGHHQGNAFLRDAIKREVLRRAGIPLIEVEPDFDAAHLRRRLTGHLAPPQGASVTPLDSRRS